MFLCAVHPHLARNFVETDKSLYNWHVGLHKGCRIIAGPLYWFLVLISAVLMQIANFIWDREGHNLIFKLERTNLIEIGKEAVLQLDNGFLRTRSTLPYCTRF